MEHDFLKDSRSDISYLMNGNFCSIGANLANKSEDAPNPLFDGEYVAIKKNSRFKFKHISTLDVRNGIAKLKTAKSFGDDNISNYFLICKRKRQTLNSGGQKQHLGNSHRHFLSMKAKQLLQSPCVGNLAFNLLSLRVMFRLISYVLTLCGNQTVKRNIALRKSFEQLILVKIHLKTT